MRDASAAEFLLCRGGQGREMKPLTMETQTFTRALSIRVCDIAIRIHIIETSSCLFDASMPRNAGTVDTRTVLKTYNISSTNPKRWQDTSLERPKPKVNRRQNRYSVLQDQRLDYDEDASRPADAVEDEDDPLGVVGGGVFKYLQ